MRAGAASSDKIPAEDGEQVEDIGLLSMLTAKTFVKELRLTTSARYRQRSHFTQHSAPGYATQNSIVLQWLLQHQSGTLDLVDVSAEIDRNLFAPPPSPSLYPWNGEGTSYNVDQQRASSSSTSGTASSSANRRSSTNRRQAETTSKSHQPTSAASSSASSSSRYNCGENVDNRQLHTSSASGSGPQHLREVALPSCSKETLLTPRMLEVVANAIELVETVPVDDTMKPRRTTVPRPAAMVDAAMLVKITRPPRSLTAIIRQREQALLTRLSRQELVGVEKMEACRRYLHPVAVGTRRRGRRGRRTPVTTTGVLEDQAPGDGGIGKIVTNKTTTVGTIVTNNTTVGAIIVTSVETTILGVIATSEAATGTGLTSEAATGTVITSEAATGTVITNATKTAAGRGNLQTNRACRFFFVLEMINVFLFTVSRHFTHHGPGIST
eukprot:GSA25T00022427001.1